MGSLNTSMIAFVIIFVGAVVGMLLRKVLPVQHLRDDSRDVIKLATGLVGTMARWCLACSSLRPRAFMMRRPRN